jgi:hypothetical protein
MFCETLVPALTNPVVFTLTCFLLNCINLRFLLQILSIAIFHAQPATVIYQENLPLCYNPHILSPTLQIAYNTLCNTNTSLL